MFGSDEKFQGMRHFLLELSYAFAEFGKNNHYCPNQYPVS